MPNTANPIIANLNNSIAFTEGDPAILLDPDVTISDADLDALNGGLGDYGLAELTITSFFGSVSEIFDFATMTNVARAGNTLVSGGNVVANIVTSASGITISFTSINGTIATTALVNEIVQAITWHTTSQNPPSGVTLTYTFSDGDIFGPLTDVGSIAVNVTPVNQAPMLAGDFTAAMAEGGTYTLTSADLAFTDPDDGASDVTFTVSGLSNGSILVNGNGQTTFTGFDLFNGIVKFQHNGSEATTAGFNVKVEDGNEDGSPPSIEPFDITVTPVNDAPVLAGDRAATMSEGGLYAITLADISFTDPDNDPEDVTITVSGLSNGSILVNGNVQTTFTGLDLWSGLVKFQHDGSEFATAGFDVSVEDGNEDNSAPVAQAFTVTVNPVNDAPVITGDLATTVNEGGAVTLSFADLGFTDPDDGLAGVTYTVSNLSNGTVLVDGNASTTFTGLDLTGGLVKFQHDGSETVAAGLDVAVEDGDEDDSLPAPQAFSISVTPVNEAPVLTGDLTATVNEGGSFLISGSDLGFTDPDDSPAEVTFTASNLSHGEIRVGGIAQSTFTGLQLLSGEVQFFHDGSEAAAAGFDIKVEDGNEDGSVPGAQAFSIAVNPVNDAPVVTGDLSAEIDEGGAYTLTGVDLGFIDADDAPADVTFTASNFSSNGTILVNGIAATTFTGLDLQSGLVKFQHDGSETSVASFDVAVEDGNEDLSIPVAQTFSLSVDPVNDAPQLTGDLTAAMSEGGLYQLTLADLNFTDPDDGNFGVTFLVSGLTDVTILFNGNATTFFTWSEVLTGAIEIQHSGAETTAAQFMVSVEDGNEDNSAPVAQAFNITVTPTNDAPQLTGDLSATVNEGGSVVLMAADLGFIDVDDAAAGVTFTAFNVTAGTILVDGNAQSAFTVQQLLDGKVAYQHDGSQTTAATFDVQVEDGNEDNSVPIAQTLSVTVNPINQAPVLTGDLSAEVTAGGAYTLNGTDLGFTDPDNTSADITFNVSNLVHGEVRVNGSAATSFTAGQLASGVVDFAHDGLSQAAGTFEVAVEDLDQDVSTPVPATFTVSTVNAGAPQLDGLNSGNPRFYIEQDPAFVLAPTATVFDSDFSNFNGGAGNWSGAEITVTSGEDPEVASFFVFDFATMVNVVRAGSTLLSNGSAIANLGSNTGNFTITFTDANGEIPTSALVNEILQGITFANTSDAPSQFIQLDLEVTDNHPGGSLSDNGSIFVLITPVNDAPTLSGDFAGIVLQGGTRVLTMADVFATDPETDSGDLTFTASNAVGGEIRVNGIAQSTFTGTNLALGAVTFVHNGPNTDPATFDIAASDGNLTSAPATVTLTVAAVNTAPVLSSGGGAATWDTIANENATVQGVEIDFEVLSNAQILRFTPSGVGGTPVAEVTAADPEETPITYSIVGGADAALFSFNASNSVLSGSASGQIFFLNPAGQPGIHFTPDFENPTDFDADGIYEVLVRASDGVNTTDQLVRIDIQDVAEAPRFDNGLPARLIGVADGATAVGAVTATDDDTGDTVTYALAGGQHEALFAIDSNTGMLSFTAPQNYFNPNGINGSNLYEVRISASDGTNSSAQEVYVRVLNPNNVDAPVFNGFAINSSLAISSPENIAANVIYPLDAFDAEGQASGGGLVWSITGGADAAFFTIDAVTGAISFATDPDFENPADTGLNNTYEVTVKVTDEYGAGLSDEETLTFTITEAVNTAPQLLGFHPAVPQTDEFNALAPENTSTSLGIPILATDPEGQTSGNGLVWEIVSVANGGEVDADDVTINANTGAISFAASPDFELPTDANGDNVYQFTVKVTDNFGTGLSAQQNFSIAVENLNDGGGNNDPTITGLDATRGALPGGSAVVLDTDVTLADAEHNLLTGFLSLPGDYGGSTLIVQRQGGAIVSDEFSFLFTGSAASQLTIEGEPQEIRFQGTPFAVSTNGGEFGATGVMAITFLAGAPALAVNTVVRAITYRNASSSTDDITLEYVFSDGDGGSASDTIVVSSNGGSNANLISSFGGKATATHAIIENKTAVTTIQTSHSGSQPLKYSIVGGNDSSAFAINALTGALTMLSGPDYEAPADSDADNVYQVIVGVETTGSEAGLFDSQAISVVIADLDGATVTGTTKAETLTGTIEGDTISGLGGNDILIGKGSGDILDGGIGIDTASYAGAAGGVHADLSLALGFGGDATADTFVSIENLIGSSFGDILIGDNLANLVNGGAGDDTIEGGGGNDVLIGGTGIDTVSYEHAGSGVVVSLALTAAQKTLGAGIDKLSGFENLTGSAFNDVLTGDKNANIIKGGDGSDVIQGGAGPDQLDGEGGVNTVSYAASKLGVIVDLSTNSVSGGDAAGDIIQSFQSVIGSAKADILSGAGFGGLIEGGAGADVLTGGAGDTLSYANAKAAVTVNLGLVTAQLGTGDAKGDIISGFESVFGGKGADKLTGDGDANIIKGGAGADILTGGGGLDTFMFGALAEKGDHITDFTSGTDRLQFLATGFASLAAGPLAGGTTSLHRQQRACKRNCPGRVPL